jgi:uncharacterized membrane-anchored protein YjiN (DUF445 family)
MTDLDKQEFKSLIKEGTLSALKSDEGQDAIASALKSEPAKEAILDIFVAAFHEVVVPLFEDIKKDQTNYSKRLLAVEERLGESI